MLIGIFWSFLSAVLLGFYALPTKYTKNFAWENTWGGFFFMSMVVVPIIFTFSLVDGVGATYSQVSGDIILLMIFMGFVWGVGNMMWGYSIASIGMALGFSLFLGVVTLVGAILPFFISSAEFFGTTGGNLILGGILVCVIGIAASGYAGMLRDKDKQTEGGKKGSKVMALGIVLCVFGGILAAGFNIGYHIGDHIDLGNIGNISSEQFGNTPWIARLAVLFPIFMGAAISNMSYFVYMLSKRKTWKNFMTKGIGMNLLLVFTMAIFHDMALTIYGLGAYELGGLGTSVGFAIFESGAILVANISGIATKEWKGASRKSIAWMIIGLLVLIGGIIMVSYGNFLIET